ncbi:MAG: [FeFe] hydrogenase H-cluster radical SAM maturase HydE [Spirochaetales bacterium]
MNHEVDELMAAAAEHDRRAIGLLLARDDAETSSALAARARDVMASTVGSKVYYRGLLEFSNICALGCLYCGIRAQNASITRYTLDEEEILEAALATAHLGYGSMTLQSGERTDRAFTSFVTRTLRRIKRETTSEALPDGLGITLCVGEQSTEVYEEFFAAGAHRYLLRMETSSPELFAQIHPTRQRYDSRLRCLRNLKQLGYQVGTGVMIGIPGQTYEQLADDVLFFVNEEVDMIGMGPYVPHSETPMGRGDSDSREERGRRLRLSLRMIALTRIVSPWVNIAAATALQAIDPLGREKALRAGANILMPIVTPTENRADYLLYDNKPCVDEDRVACASCLATRVASTNRPVAVNEWGDAPQYGRRLAAQEA